MRPAMPVKLSPETVDARALGCVASPADLSRRRFLGGGVLGGAAAVSCDARAALPTGGVFAAGEQRLRVGLIGCGGRGTGAALHAMQADPSVRLVAMGDVFADQVASAAVMLQHESAGVAGRFDCPAARCFVGQDAFLRVLDSGVDVVLLAAPPHVRPLHFEAAILAGKHVYCEKPVAIDAAGVVRVAAAAARSRAAGLAVVSGFCFRRDARMAELVSRIHDGALGRPRLVQAHSAIGLPWRRPMASGHPSGDWPLRNWISYTRFSGGHLVDQHVQAIDRAAWIMGDSAPLTAEVVDDAAMPEVRIHDDHRAHDHRVYETTGAIGDCRASTAVRYLFADGRAIEASIDRRERACDRIVETVVGTQGSCDLLRGTVVGIRGRTTFAIPGPGRFAAAMTDLVGGILAGLAPNDGETMCRSTLMAVMGRMASEKSPESRRRVAWSDLPDGASRLA